MKVWAGAIFGASATPFQQQHEPAADRLRPYVRAERREVAIADIHVEQRTALGPMARSFPGDDQTRDAR